MPETRDPASDMASREMMGRGDIPRDATPVERTSPGAAQHGTTRRHPTSRGGPVLRLDPSDAAARNQAGGNAPSGTTKACGGAANDALPEGAARRDATGDNPSVGGAPTHDSADNDASIRDAPAVRDRADNAPSPQGRARGGATGGNAPSGAGHGAPPEGMARHGATGANVPIGAASPRDALAACDNAGGDVPARGKTGRAATGGDTPPGGASPRDASAVRDSTGNDAIARDKAQHGATDAKPTPRDSAAALGTRNRSASVSGAPEGPLPAHVFALPPGCDYARALVQGLRARLDGQPPEAMARVLIYVNMRRMERRLNAIFAEGPAGFLPRIRLIADLAQDQHVPGLPAPVPALRRRLNLANAVSRLLDSQPDLAPRAALYDLADSLAALMDEMQGEGVSVADLAALDVSNHSAHWARSLKFLGVIAQHWAPGLPPDREERQRRAVLHLERAWAEAPPDHPVILAGSTGSRGTTARFMQAVARLPHGAVVLPGFDFHMPGEVWAALDEAETGEDHPQFRFRRVMQALGLRPDEIRPWVEAPPASAARNRLISLALRPAPVTDQWRAEGPALKDISGAARHMTLVEAATPPAEALAIALRLRAAAETGETAALITPDRVLTRYVTAALERWRIVPDDSAGLPLALSPPGRFLRLVAGLFGTRLTGGALVALLNHPLTHSGAERGAHLRRTRDLELKLLRGGPPVVDFAAIRVWAAEREAGSGRGRTPDPGAVAWAAWLSETLEGTAAIGARALAAHVQAHRGLAERLAAGAQATGSGALWDEVAGEAARAAMAMLEAEAARGAGGEGGAGGGGAGAGCAAREGGAATRPEGVAGAGGAQTEAGGSATARRAETEAKGRSRASGASATGSVVTGAVGASGAGGANGECGATGEGGAVAGVGGSAEAGDGDNETGGAGAGTGGVSGAADVNERAAAAARGRSVEDAQVGAVGSHARGVDGVADGWGQPGAAGERGATGGGDDGRAAGEHGEGGADDERGAPGDGGGSSADDKRGAPDEHGAADQGCAPGEHGVANERGMADEHCAPGGGNAPDEHGAGNAPGTGNPASRPSDAVEPLGRALAGTTPDPREYEALFHSVLDRETVRRATRAHPRIMIWGTLEARVQGADLVILAGLNEGVWPRLPPPDPWLNRAMRKAAGLLLPERRIGLAAHDFQQAVAAPEVMLTRAVRDTEAPTVAARWLNRLTNLMGGVSPEGAAALEGMRARGREWLDMAAALQTPATLVPPEPRPSPRPPVAARPRQLSVTRIKTLIRDPYAIYARHILRLKPLDPLQPRPDPMLRGSLIHAVMHRFINETRTALPPADQARARLLAIAEAELNANAPWPAARRIWLARLVGVADDFLADEARRRAGASPLALERRGEQVLDGVDFRLTGILDRVDMTAEGTLIIYDYKTGKPPTAKQVRLFDRQLPLEGAMAERGAFEGLAPACVTGLRYIGLGSDAGEAERFDDGLIGETWHGLSSLILSWDKRATGYTSRARVEESKETGDYDHLARLGEWDQASTPEPEEVG